MNFEKTLISGEFVKRYKRFFVDVKVDNLTITAHCPNTGSMMGLINSGCRVWLSHSDNPKRKLKYTLQIIEQNQTKVGINTHLTNKIVFKALKDNCISEFKNLDTKHKSILNNYFGQEWDKCLKEMNLAKSLCNNLMKEYYEIMAQRIDEYKISPPPEDWDGVYVSTSK